jgi:hypothetical protein
VPGERAKTAPRSRGDFATEKTECNVVVLSDLLIWGNGKGLRIRQAQGGVSWALWTVFGRIRHKRVLKKVLMGVN